VTADGSSPDLAAQKLTARTAAFAVRKAAYRAGQGQAAELLADYLGACRGRALAGYMPMRTEINPLAAMAAHQGPVCVPVILGPDQPLKFREWTPGCAMTEGAFGALIPADGPWIIPEVLIVPLLAFDARGFRLGYGGGYYDRTLEPLRRSRAIVAIGFAFAAQQVPQVPTGATDQPLDAILTEQGPLPCVR